MVRKTIFPLLAVAAALLWPASAAQAAKAIRWGNSYTAAIAQAKKTGQLIMVDFFTDWCGYCKKLDAVTYVDPAVIKESEQLIPLKLDAEREGRSLAMQLKPKGFPSIYFLNGNGEVEGLIGGYLPPSSFLSAMKHYIDTHRDLPTWQRQLTANPNDLPLAAKLTQIYADMGRHKQATQALAQVTRLDPNSQKGFLTRSTLAVARMWMEGRQADQAVPLMRQATRTARTSEERAVAHINLALCYGQMNNVNALESELNTTMSLPDCPPQIKQAAQQIMARVQQYKSQKH
jgi:thioredoxin-like negative regulator of GroEL